jgi:GT2 family glycosyltransferase
LPEKHDAERKAVAAHLRRLGWNAVVEPAVHPACRDVRFPWHGDGRVAIVIPTRNRHDLLARCVASIEATVPPGLASLCVMDHESDDPATLAFLDGLAGRHAVLPYRGRFNFAAMMNAAAARLGRDFPLLLFLNNDTEATAPGWLEHMVGLARRPDVGVVGAVLWYPDRRVQHAGVWVGMHRAADHPWRGLPALEPDGRRSAGPGMSLLATRDQSAVTGACLLIRSEVFAAAGGFDEELRIGFNDTDLCLKVRRLGYRVLLDGQAVLLHHESATRGKEGLDPHPDDTHRFQERYAELIEAGDPYYSSLLSCHDETRLAADACSALSGPARTVAVVLPRPPAPPVRRAA